MKVKYLLIKSKTLSELLLLTDFIETIYFFTCIRKYIFVERHLLKLSVLFSDLWKESHFPL